MCLFFLAIFLVCCVCVCFFFLFLLRISILICAPCRVSLCAPLPHTSSMRRQLAHQLHQNVKCWRMKCAVWVNEWKEKVSGKWKESNGWKVRNANVHIPYGKQIPNGIAFVSARPVPFIEKRHQPNGAWLPENFIVRLCPHTCFIMCCKYLAVGARARNGMEWNTIGSRAPKPNDTQDVPTTNTRAKAFADDKWRAIIWWCSTVYVYTVYPVTRHAHITHTNTHGRTNESNNNGK